jgi:hypothetical protein
MQISMHTSMYVTYVTYIYAGINYTNANGALK